MKSMTLYLPFGCSESSLANNVSQKKLVSERTSGVMKLSFS